MSVKMLFLPNRVQNPEVCKINTDSFVCFAA